MMMLARDSRGVTQAELSSQLAISQGALSKYETGFSDPPMEFIEELGGALGYPSGFFFEEGRPYGFPPFHYRKRKKLSAKALGRIVAEMNIRRMHIKKLLVSFGSYTNSFIPEIDMDEYQGRSKARLSVEDVARQVREMWMLPDGPIPNMVDLLEERGGIVVPCDFGTELIDAISQRIDGLPVLFFVNVNSPADRLRHTLAHELGHMVLHTVTLADDTEMEEQADAFAGAFLLPADEVRPQLRRFDLRRAANLKSYWKVSMAALAVRADRLNLLTSYQRRNFWMEMSRLGYRKREPVEIPPERPKLLRQMVAFHLNKLGYSVGQLAQMLHLTVAEFQEMYRTEILGGGPSTHSSRGHLRVVK